MNNITEKKDLIMPISALQHRVSTGAYQNKRQENFRVNSTTRTQGINPEHSAIPNERHHSGISIKRAVNFYNELSRPCYQTTSPRQGIAAPLLMLLSQVRLADSPLEVAGRTTVSGSAMKHPVSENFEQSPGNNNLLSALSDFIPSALSRADKFMLQYDPLRFPEASALPAGGYQDEEIIRFPRYAVFKKKTTTPPPVADDVKIEKLDFSCFEESQNLSISDVFRKIGETLSNPVSELAKESQVIHYYNNYHRCPTPEEMAHLLTITKAVDKTISIITALLPGSQPLMVTQGLGGPLFRMIADSIDNKELNIDDITEANSQLLALGKSIVDTSPKNPKGQTIEEQLRVPEGLIFKNNKLSVNINGAHRTLTIKNGHYSANINGKRRRVSYSSENKQWTKTHRYIQTSGDNISFPHRIGKLLSGSVDKKTLATINPNQHGIYTITSKNPAESGHVIKIGDKFYRYQPVSEENVSLSGVIKTDNVDIPVTRFGKRYFIVNDKKRLTVNYSPCRLVRAPGLSCLHLSDGLLSKLKENRSHGTPERKIKGFKPSENNPGLYESAKGVLYLKYEDAYFRLIRLEDGVADSQYMVKGRKRFGSKEITPVCYSREKGVNYMNTPQENMMESAGVSKNEAISHLEDSSQKNSASTVNHSGNDEVLQDLAGSRLKQIDVGIGEVETVTDSSTTLTTESLTFCSALIVLSDWNGASYGSRTLTHLNGSHVSAGLKYGGDASELISQLQKQLVKGGKIIWVGGCFSQSDFSLGMSIGQTNSIGEKPLYNLMRTPGITIDIAGSAKVSVFPDGTFNLGESETGRGVLTKEEVNKILDIAADL